MDTFTPMYVVFGVVFIVWIVSAWLNFTSIAAYKKEIKQKQLLIDEIEEEVKKLKRALEKTFMG